MSSYNTLLHLHWAAVTLGSLVWLQLSEDGVLHFIQDSVFCVIAVPSSKKVQLDIHMGSRHSNLVSILPPSRGLPYLLLSLHSTYATWHYLFLCFHSHIILITSYSLSAYLTHHPLIWVLKGLRFFKILLTAIINLDCVTQSKHSRK